MAEVIIDMPGHELDISLGVGYVISEPQFGYFSETFPITNGVLDGVAFQGGGGGQSLIAPPSVTPTPYNLTITIPDHSPLVILDAPFIGDFRGTFQGPTLEIGPTEIVPGGTLATVTIEGPVNYAFVTPEPGTWLMLAIGFIAFALLYTARRIHE